MTTILLADDLAENRYLLVALFKGHGFDAVEAANGAEALALASTSPPDLIITDILMPVMDGFELCRRWKAEERLKAIPFLFYTATYTDLEDEKFALNLGAERFLTKPQSPEALMRVVREVLAEARQPQRGEGTLLEANEKDVLQHYNEALFRKLQKKVHDLETEMAERKRLEVSLAQADRLASMGMLAAGVAHEINNPLSYVLYNLEGLAAELPSCASRIARARDVLMGCLSEKKLREILGVDMVAFETEPILDVATCFRDALEGAQRIKEIVRGLSAFSRVENGHLSLVNIHSPMESAIVIAFNEIKYRARIQRDFGAVAEVFASEGHLSQIFLNLIVNAAHSISEGNVDGNRITIRSWQEGNMVCAEVSDSGSGIAPHHLQHIFEPFFTTKPVGVGSGLGLPIVRSILARYSGTIEVHSQVGKGSTFIVRLPAALPEHLSLHPRSSGADQTTVPRARILIIDDERLVSDVLRRILKEHEVVIASSGEEALHLLGQDQLFDLILCDVMMPRTSGIDVHRWLAETNPELARKLVFVTGGVFTTGATEYLEHVENPRLEKPFNAVLLQQKVLEWVAAAKLETS